MKRFLRILLLFTIPFLVLVGLYIVTDPFRILYHYQDYYGSDNFVNLNRAVINARTYLRNRDKLRYNAFIFGSSRSLPVHTPDWKKFLPSDAVPFHYDSYAESILGINRKVKFIDRNSDTIKYAIIFLDQMLLEETFPVRKGHLYAEYPAVSRGSWIDYHLMFIKAFLNPRFFTGYFYRKVTGQYRQFMGGKILNQEYPMRWDPLTSDLYLGQDIEIMKDSARYFSEREYLVTKRDTTLNRTLLPTPEEERLLVEIKEIFDRHKTDYRIISNPFVSQFRLCRQQKELLIRILGSDNFFDYSGPVDFSNYIHNFYDPSHFRPKVAREIMKEVYEKKPAVRHTK